MVSIAAPKLITVARTESASRPSTQPLPLFDLPAV
jgi:hypothetical protein